MNFMKHIFQLNFGEMCLYRKFWVNSFGVRVSVMFPLPHLMFVHYTLVRFGLLSGHLKENSSLLGWPYVLTVFCLLVFLFISHFSFKSGIWLLIAPVPVLCFSITSIQSFVLLKRSKISILWVWCKKAQLIMFHH